MDNHQRNGKFISKCCNETPKENGEVCENKHWQDGKQHFQFAQVLWKEYELYSQQGLKRLSTTNIRKNYLNSFSVHVFFPGSETNRGQRHEG